MHLKEWLCRITAANDPVSSFRHVATHSTGRTAGSAAAEQQPAKQEAAATPAACSVLWSTTARWDWRSGQPCQPWVRHSGWRRHGAVAAPGAGSANLPLPLSTAPVAPSSHACNLLSIKPIILAHAGPSKANRGLGVLEWAGGIVSQGTLVKTAKFGWRTAWEALMTELAPQVRRPMRSHNACQHSSRIATCATTQSCKRAGALGTAAPPQQAHLSHAPCCTRRAAPAVQSKDGTYQRPSYSFKDQLGSPGFPLEKGRYHLYVGNACPWCHRVLLALVVCGLEEYVRWVPAAPCCDGSVDLPGRCDCNHHIPSARPQHQAGRCPRDAHAARMQLTSHPPAAHLQLLPGGRRPRAGQPGRLGVRLARPGVWLPGPEASCITCRGCKP